MIRDDMQRQKTKMNYLIIVCEPLYILLSTVCNEDEPRKICTVLCGQDEKMMQQVKEKENIVAAQDGILLLHFMTSLSNR